MRVQRLHWLAAALKGLDYVAAGVDELLRRYDPQDDDAQVDERSPYDFGPSPLVFPPRTA